MRNPQPPADASPAGTEPPEGTNSWIPAYAGMTEGAGVIHAPVNGLTLTGLYNLLNNLRLGEPLNAKEKTLHEQGLVSVLRSLHDELDAAVLAAYGWSDLGAVPWGDEAARAAWTESLLERLVALNARRAAEEAGTLPGSPPGGLVRWLRPDFQDPARRAAREGAARAADLAAAQTAAQAGDTLQTVGSGGESLPNQEQDKTISRWEQTDLVDKLPEKEPAAPSTPVASAPPWPSTLPEQVRAVAQLLSASPAPLPLSAVEAGFKGKGPWKKGLPRILETLEALGRARREGDGLTESWRC